MQEFTKMYSLFQRWSWSRSRDSQWPVNCEARVPARNCHSGTDLTQSIFRWLPLADFTKPQGKTLFLSLLRSYCGSIQSLFWSLKLVCFRESHTWTCTERSVHGYPASTGYHYCSPSDSHSVVRQYQARDCLARWDIHPRLIRTKEFVVPLGWPLWPENIPREIPVSPGFTALDH